MVTKLEHKKLFLKQKKDEGNEAQARPEGSEKSFVAMAAE